eukprot:TRINITY_DN8138_c0_g1_i2.p1 TRINITY_DN8138_c0_g1~~TRINITY_DN8138_c0_g1_i2.p1  ORF type:complete len:284 (-),score=38.95 TRINITY_DN8138_c0_g1_i2:377-1228(-)
MAWMDWGDVLGQDVSTAKGFWTVALLFAGMFLMAWACIVLLLTRLGVGREFHGVRRGTWALKITMLLHHIPVSYLAFAGILGDDSVMMLIRCFGCSDASLRMIQDREAASGHARFLVPVTIGYMVADLVLLSQWQLAKGGGVETCLMLLHHFLSICSWPVTLYFDFCSRYVLILLSYESSSIFMTVMWLLTTAGLKKSLLYKVNGAVFTLSFVLLRVVGALPQVRGMWQHQPWFSGAYVAVPQWVLTGSSWLILPHILNAFWGYKVVTGFLAVVMKKGDKKQS